MAASLKDRVPRGKLLEPGLRARVRARCGRHPTLFFNVYAHVARISHAVVRRDTELVIEGFPRSANTFAVSAFHHAQATRRRVSHHMHVPAQVIRAVDWGIPTLVLIRPPRDAILSRLVQLTGVDATLPTAHLIRSYIEFYEALQGLRHGFVVATFDQVTRDFGVLIDEINQKFGSAFGRFEHSPKNEREVFDHLDRLLVETSGQLSAGRLTRPSPRKESFKGSVNYLLDDRTSRQLLEKAETIHRKFLAE